MPELTFISIPTSSPKYKINTIKILISTALWYLCNTYGYSIFYFIFYPLLFLIIFLPLWYYIAAVKNSIFFPTPWRFHLKPSHTGISIPWNNSSVHVALHNNILHCTILCCAAQYYPASMSDRVKSSHPRLLCGFPLTVLYLPHLCCTAQDDIPHLRRASWMDYHHPN